jgi:predicted phosphodiesterase
MTHIGGYPNHYAPQVKSEIYTKPPMLFISGHSHILKVIYDEKIKCLHINPGAAGKHGWHKVRTLIRFCISEEKIHTLEAIELGIR